jgi:hypothetical protein
VGFLKGAEDVGFQSFHGGKYGRDDDGKQGDSTWRCTLRGS